MSDRKWKIIFLAGFVLLVFFQIKTTNIKQAYSFTPAQVDQQIQRMNMYPPALARLGYILEVKKEVQLLRKVEENFFTAVDPKEYFPNRIPYVLSPFVLVGLFILIRDRNAQRPLYYAFLFSIAILTIIGPYAKYGPVLLMPFLIYFVVLGLLGVLRLTMPS